MPVDSPDVVQWTAFQASLDLFNVNFTTYLTQLDSDAKQTFCDRVGAGLPIGPPLFDSCTCDHEDPDNPSIGIEGEFFQCCTPLIRPSFDQAVSPPDCIYTTPAPVIGLEVGGLPEGLTVVILDASEVEAEALCPPSDKYLCVQGTPAEGTGTLQGTVYKFNIVGENCYGSDTTQCSLMVKSSPTNCDANQAVITP